MNQYFIHDARNLDELPLKTLVDLIITSPPYFDMKDYGSKNQIGFGQGYDSYLDDIEEVFRKAYVITRDSGSLWIVVDILRKDGELKLLPFDMIQRIQKSGWHLRDIIIWEKDKTVPYTHSGEMRNIFEYVLYFSKTENFKFYRERITYINDIKEWWQRYPERYSPNGKSPSNIWEFPIPLQGSWGKTYIKHFCPLPESLIERIINLSSDINDTVLDPFAGSGAVLSAAYKLKRNYIGCDLNVAYKQMFVDYIADVKPINVNNLYNNGVSDKFSKSIKKLRLLKYPKKLYSVYKKKYKNSAENIQAIIAIPLKSKEDLPKNKFSELLCIFVIDDETEINTEQFISITTKQPLSKFGIQPQIKILNPKQAMKYLKEEHKITGYWEYTNGISYQVGKKVKILSLESLKKDKPHQFPPIFSTLGIKEEDLELEV